MASKRSDCLYLRVLGLRCGHHCLIVDLLSAQWLHLSLMLFQLLTAALQYCPNAHAEAQCILLEPLLQPNVDFN